ncbi:aminotransferase class IV family protein [Streptomyces sp. NPDC048441]|uniref:aminotransferase class IV family protein n=1 Tax=Streptomyces sp. NPDC048441 TaxID=3365552 RepID=UPI003721CCB1
MALLNGRTATVEDFQALGLTGYGHFTSMRVDNRRIRGLTLHLDRLVRDCRQVFGAELDPKLILSQLKEAIDGIDGIDGTTGSFVVRVTVFDPDFDMGRPDRATNPQILITHRPAAALPLPPLRVKSFPYTRDVAEVKHLGLFGALHHRRAALLDGYDDALFVGANGRISEGSTWNVGFVDGNGTVLWPEGDVLPGVSMALLQQQSECMVTSVHLDQLDAMQAAFATNTTIGIRPISVIDTLTFPSEHPVLNTLRQTFLSLPGDRVCTDREPTTGHWA